MSCHRNIQEETCNTDSSAKWSNVSCTLLSYAIYITKTWNANQVHLWMFRFENWMFFTIRCLEVQKFTSLMPKPLLCIWVLSFLIVSLKIPFRLSSVFKYFDFRNEKLMHINQIDERMYAWLNSIRRYGIILLITEYVKHVFY